MQTMSDTHRNGNGTPDTDEWAAFRHDAEEHRKDLERSLRRLLIHDPRAMKQRIQSVSPPDLADEAFTWALDEWRSKPTGTSPEQWMRTRALHLLDEALDLESLAAESRDEDRREENRQLARELLKDDEERERRLELLEDSVAEQPVQFDGLAADDEVSSVESRLDATEVLEHLDRALARLPEIRRRIVVHSYLDELSAEDVAYLLDLSVADVEGELASAVKSLRLELTPKS